MITKFEDFLAERKKNQASIETAVNESFEFEHFEDTKLSKETLEASVKEFINGLIETIKVETSEDMHQSASEAIANIIKEKIDAHLIGLVGFENEEIENEENEEIEEGFLGFGKKTYMLDDTFKASKEAEEFFNKRKDLVKIYTTPFTKRGLSGTELDNAIKALKMFVGDGIPQLKDYTFTYEPETKKFVIDPNGKGLFNGSPVMG